MAAPRASWKGFLKIAEVTCPVGLYAAVSSSERIVLHTVNRQTGNRVSRQYVDVGTGEPVESEDQVKGYEVGKDEYLVLEPEEIAAAVPESDKRLTVSAFVSRDEIDDVYFDRPYFLAPSDRSADEAFELIREGLRASNTAAIARAVLFRRVRTLMIRPLGAGLAATSLNFDYEVRSAKEAFAEVPALEIKGEMLELAEHIIRTKQGGFDPASVQDRYEAALAELVKAKIEGRKIEAPKRPKRAAPSDLMAALRESAAMSGKPPPPAKAAPPSARARKKAS
jgi:DNA end-binding protein Ku